MRIADKKINPGISGVYFFIEELFSATSFSLFAAAEHSTRRKKVVPAEAQHYLFQHLYF